MLQGYLTVKQVTKQLGLSEYRVHEIIWEKQIKAIKIAKIGKVI